MAEPDATLCVLEAALGGEHEASDGIETWVLEAEATLVDGHVGNDVGMGWEGGGVGNVGEHGFGHVTELVGEATIPQVNVGWKILKWAVNYVATKKVCEFVDGADTI